MADFTPTLYLKDKCPFCFKVRIALVEAGLFDKVNVREFVPGDDEEAAIRETLAPHFEKVTFPAAEVAPGKFVADSDGITAQLLATVGKKPEDMTALGAYLRGPFASIMTLYKENSELKKQLA
ncbi:glutathione S-transferase N-terminal domain-containing protein [Sphingobium sp. H33]|uniref:Glutathione S-transferase N-terminal domain-containing protein n=2 Tax=Sphingobium nicotianae TaxID=2782607 RepID=A0A9X1AIR1_9SPHN|nr:glutathione S-transferase N-terminal domain-containing protein [Sphingobium nicotianae]